MFADLDTPCLLLDRARMAGNLNRMHERISSLGGKFRPHLKTIKSIDALPLIFDGGIGPITVSTLREAEVFAGHGITDMLYAVGIAPQKLPRVSHLLDRGVDLKVCIDSMEAADFVIAQSQETGRRIPVVIEIDVDDHRSGVPWQDLDVIVELAKRLTHGAEFRGVMSHSGESYGLSQYDARTIAAEEERVRILAAVEALRSAGGVACPIVSVGATPTALAASSLEGVSELRAGVFMFFDLVQAGIGVCSSENIALSVLATVIGRRDDKGWLIVDAGWTAMSQDRGTAGQVVDQHYGIVCNIDGQPYQDIVLARANQEHGIITCRPGSKAALPPLTIGDRVRILPNHACATAHLHESYVLVEQGAVAGTWSRFRGW